MKIKISELEELVTKILLTEYSSEEASLIKDVIMFGELSGKPSHGLLRLIKGNFGVFVDEERGKPEYDRKTKVSTVIDAKGSPGMLAAPLAVNEAIRIGKENGIGIVGVKGTYNSTGSVSYYMEKIAKEDLIGIAFIQSINNLIAPFGTKKPLFGTNPIAFGVPADPKPFVFDMSTSAIAYGNVMNAKINNKKLPENVAIDKDGNPTTDPADVTEGALLPLGDSYKGSGLAMMVELLGSVWVGGGFATQHLENGCGNLYIAMSPDLLSDVKSFKKRVAELVEKVRSAETRDGTPVRLPGENTFAKRDKSLETGEVEINETTFAKIQEQYLNGK